MTGSWTGKAIVVLALVTAGTLACESDAAARSGGGKGGGGAGGRSGHHSGKHSGHHHAHVGVAAGAALATAYWPWWNYPPYYPAAAIGAGPPLEYIERGEQEALLPEDWLYCAGAQGYFPYVAECPGGWERVPAAPLK